MITPRDIVRHVSRYLPRVSTRFTENIIASSVEVGANNVITVTTAAPHGLTQGATFSFASGKVQTDITSFVRDDTAGTVTFTTANQHDQTKNQRIASAVNVELSGFTDTAYNGVQEIIEVPNRNQFTINLPNIDPLTLNGNEKLIEERSLSVFDILQVASVISATEFTAELPSDVPSMQGQSILSAQIVTRARVAAVNDIDTAEGIYTKYDDGKLWAFIIMTDVDVSKDRYSINDSIATFSPQDEMRLRLLHNFSIVVFLPSRDSVSGVTAQEIAYGELTKNLLRVMYGFTGFNEEDSQSPFVTVFAGHGRGTYKDAYYTQVYDWQLPEDITYESGFNFQESVAFRDISGDLPMFNADNAERYTLAINLDEKP